MGSSSSKYEHVAPPPLQPAPRVVTVSGDTQQHEQTLRIRTPCRGQFDVRDAATDAVAYSVELGAWSAKRLIKDARGIEVLRIRRKGWKSRFTGFDAKTDARVFEMQDKSRWKRWKLRVVLGSGGEEGGAPVLLLRATAWDRRAEISLEGSDGQGDDCVIARFRRDPADRRKWYAGKQDYLIAVAANVDALLLLAIFICLDEKIRNQNNASASAGASAGASAAASVAV